MKHQLVAVAAVLVAGCGGGGSGGGAGSADSVSGIYSGTDAETGRQTQLAVLSDGSLWAYYTSLISSGDVAGAVQGDISAELGAYSSAGVRLFDFEGEQIKAGAVSGTYAAGVSLNGSIQATGTDVDFGANLIPLSNSAPSGMGIIDGTYFARFTEILNVTKSAADFSMTISLNGDVTGEEAAGGCQFAGTLKPRGDIKAFDLTIQFSGVGCRFAKQQVNGIFWPLQGSSVAALATNSNRTVGVAMSGLQLISPTP